MTSPKVILCDIEGTTTSISFVKDNLFPYAAQNVATFLAGKWEAEDTREAVKMLREQSLADQKDNVDGCVAIAGEGEEQAKQIESIVANVKWQMEHDRKAGPLKNLQGLMWVEAYKAGAFKGQVYADVAPAFEAWAKAGRKIYIYSSGSAAIQKVHFEHSEAGDLAKYLSGYFDTKVGAKQEKASYEAIWKEVSQKDEGMNVKDVLFLTDIPGEAKAAKDAGMEAILLKRPGNAELTEDQTKAYKVVESFAEIPMDGEEDLAATKRKIDDVAQDESTAIPPAKMAKIEEKPSEKEETEKETKAAAADPAAVPTECKTEEATDVPMTETVEEAKKEPAAVEEKKEVAAATETISTAPEEKTDAAADVTTDNDKKVEEKAEVPGQAEKVGEVEEKMEVDSTTAAPVAEAAKAAPKDEEMNVEEKKEVKATETESVQKELNSKETEKKEQGEDEEKKKGEEVKEVPATDDKLAEVVPVDQKATENGSTETATSTKAEETDAKAPEVETAKEKGKDAPSATDPVTNGNSTTTAESVANGSSAVEEVKANGEANGHQDNDSDKENDKSVEEAKPEEVSITTSEATGGPQEAVPEVVPVKKCAAVDPAPATATPEVAVAVEAES